MMTTSEHNMVTCCYLYLQDALLDEAEKEASKQKRSDGKEPVDEGDAEDNHDAPEEDPESEEIEEVDAEVES